MEEFAQVTCNTPIGYGQKPTPKGGLRDVGMRFGGRVGARGGAPEFICANMNSPSMKSLTTLLVLLKVKFAVLCACFLLSPVLHCKLCR